MNIYVSGLSYRINDDDLRQLFEEYGQINSAKVITDRETGRSRGFGFVEMANDEEARTAIEELTGAEYDGKVISVSEAKPKTDKPRNGGGFNRERRGGGYGERRGGYSREGRDSRGGGRGGRRDY
ncbi:MAG: RNA-binding protein [Tenuifilum sp.]|jgi:RNA recognition motif-containing protein|uniref:RNA recognition motif domain-containing protein n=1 Tax=Tenuifilum TaxID=2760873 RepID=UPI001B4F5C08|nr:RNA-binding protein [Bacteroidales bacterium]HOK60674.1 RNA-binding protein [Tenuifilum sp.]MBP9029106.1 RNA-binding protein [Bacteroidales bacterium]HOK84907.1 RNA-binding protein [Tenuifilum sp.]HOU73380.1 RNA-binding protein [Tenuifilum sp.]